MSSYNKNRLGKEFFYNKLTQNSRSHLETVTTVIFMLTDLKKPRDDELQQFKKKSDKTPDDIVIRHPGH